MNKAKKGADKSEEFSYIKRIGFVEELIKGVWLGGWTSGMGK